MEAKRAAPVDSLVDAELPFREATDMNDLPHTDLLLTEELLLLALHDRKGTVAAAHVSLGLGGAVLAELLLRERIRVDETRWRKLVKPRSPRRTNDAILNECLRRIRHAKRPASPQTWITRFAGMQRLRHRVAASLCDHGILRGRRTDRASRLPPQRLPRDRPGPGTGDHRAPAPRDLEPREDG